MHTTLIASSILTAGRRKAAVGFYGYAGAILLTLMLATGCIPKIPDDFKSEETLYEQSTRLVQAGKDEEALKFLDAFRNRYPLSPRTPEVELTIADLHFKRQEYIQAVEMYQQFVELHPTHPRVAYALIQSGKAHVKQVPKEIDRDQTHVKQAIEKFQSVRNNSEYGAQAQQEIDQLVQLLAKRDRYIADYYLKRHRWQAAEGRLLLLVENNPTSTFKERALCDLVRVYVKLGNVDAARERLQQLEALNGDAQLRAQAQALIPPATP